MKKVSLNVESLTVESFATTRPDDSRGTVMAHAVTFPAPVETCAYHCTWWPGTTCE